VPSLFLSRTMASITIVTDILLAEAQDQADDTAKQHDRRALPYDMGGFGSRPIQSPRLVDIVCILTLVGLVIVVSVVITKIGRQNRTSSGNYPDGSNILPPPPSTSSTLALLPWTIVFEYNGSDPSFGSTVDHDSGRLVMGQASDGTSGDGCSDDDGLRSFTLANNGTWVV
jgi:hypothetical protein